MGALRSGGILIAAVLLIIGGMSVFTVDERDLAVRFQFGEIIQPDYQPGLQFK